MAYKNGQHIKRIVDGNEVVIRMGVCDCDTVLYEVDLTNGKINFLVKEGRDKGHPVQRQQAIKVGGNPSAITIQCPDCGMEHHVVHTAEDTSINDDDVATFIDEITMESRGS